MVNVGPLLEARGLSKAFAIEGGIFRRRIGTVQALKDVSFNIHKGETLAVVGGSGCGKSTLARLITGLLAPDAGSLQWESQPLENFSRLERARRIQMIFQDPFASLNPKLSVETQLAEVVRVAENQPSHAESGSPNPPAPPFCKGGSKRGFCFARQQANDCSVSFRGNDDIASRCLELLNAVGLPEDTLRHYPFQFSGGQRQRIAIARALAMRPSLLVADEPLSALDVTIQANILKLLEGLKYAYALTILFITHDLAVAGNFADRALVLQDGRKVEEGTMIELLAHPRHPYTKALIEAVPRITC